MQHPIARRAVQTIVREHQQLSAVVNGMTRLVESLYIREYPEQVHHPKEAR
ncbi:hypothetical protein [Paraburkholderia atlantica]|uniref:hypothetical protein n=1 Tax=Paraburkholderia atlantica TaxID=2654982 RepID=UPI0001BF1B8F